MSQPPEKRNIGFYLGAFYLGEVRMEEVSPGQFDFQAAKYKLAEQLKFLGEFRSLKQLYSPLCTSVIF